MGKISVKFLLLTILYPGFISHALFAYLLPGGSDNFDAGGGLSIGQAHLID